MCHISRPVYSANRIQLL